MTAKRASKTIQVNHKPLHTFNYVQNPNYNFCMTLLNENNQVLFSPVQCKDYFQDIFYSEYTGHTAGIYGISWKKGMLNTDVETFKILLMGGGVNLKATIKDLKAFMNVFDKAQGFKKTDIVPTQDDGNIVVIVSKEWTQSGPMISSFMTLLRLAGGYKKTWTVQEYLKNIKPGSSVYIDLPNYSKKDVANLSTIYRRFLALLMGVKPTIDWTHSDNIMLVHNTGVVGYSNFPVAKDA